MPYEVGIARFSEIARGQIAGDTTGMLKLLFHRETRKLLGVHVIGESATEIIHIGQAVMALGGTIDYFRDTVFNYPTMAECYKVAALDGLNKLSLWAEVRTRSAKLDVMPPLAVNGVTCPNCRGAHAGTSSWNAYSMQPNDCGSAPIAHRRVCMGSSLNFLIRRD